jgi:hypothetical protein
MERFKIEITSCDTGTKRLMFIVVLSSLAA